MKRLTVEHWQNLDPWECCGQDNYCMRPSNKPGGCRNGCIVPKLYTRLAQYEDTGLSPMRMHLEITGTDAAKECGMPLSSFRRRAAIYSAKEAGRPCP